MRYHTQQLRSIRETLTPGLSVFLLITIYSIFFTFVSFSRHDNLYSRRLDLGNMDQTVWNLSHGNGFVLTDPAGDREVSRLAIHADFMMILLAPLYFIWSSPKVLLLVQTIALAVGAVPVYLLAKEKTKRPYVGVLFVCMYLLYPPLQRTNLYDFHSEAISTTLLLWTYFFLEKRRYGLMGISAFLAALGKEQLWIVFALLGGYVFVAHRKIKFGIAMMAIGLSVFYLLFWIFIPMFSVSKQHFALVYLSEFGNSQGSIIMNLLASPLKVAGTLLMPDRLYYLVQLLLPVGFLSILSPMPLLFAAPNLLINLLSNNELMRKVDFQYDSSITPFIMVSAVGGFMVLLRLLARVKSTYKGFPFRTAVFLTAACMMFGVYLWGEVPYTRLSRFFWLIYPQAEQRSVLSFVSEIAEGKTVSVTNNIGAHVSRRRVVWNFPVKAGEADYVLVNLGDPYAWPSQEDQEVTVKKLLDDPAYELAAQYGNFYGFRRK